MVRPDIGLVIVSLIIRRNGIWHPKNGFFLHFHIFFMLDFKGHFWGFFGGVFAFIRSGSPSISIDDFPVDTQTICSTMCILHMSRRNKSI